jgi:hypothetical protein
MGILMPKGEWTETQKKININDNIDKQQLAEAIRDSLGLMGWCPYWTQHRDKEIYSFEITHNGAEYRIAANIDSGNVSIKRRPKGLGSILNSLHFFNEDLPSGTKIVNTWRYYKDLCFIYLLIAIVTGIWLTLKSRKKFREIIVLCSALAMSCILILYVWLS